MFNDGVDSRPENPRYRPPTNVTVVNDKANLSNVTNIFEGLRYGTHSMLAHYDEAIAWFEGVIINPETTYADSIFAAIDLGNLYLEMEANGTKAVGKLLQYKPESRPAFEKQCEYALSLLPSQTNNNQDPAIRYVEPLPYWVDTITTQPEGYVMDTEGNVEISSSDGLVWLISAVNGLNGCEPDDFDGRTVRLTQDIDFGEIGYDYNF
ncbi:MAG: hypothetical protein IJP44_01750, partial [Bacteroidales bacterium]|nr:hypothetical protein [Bacteroidales bacterium]